ncbi:hypothetical protein [Streptomyces sp. NBC_01358]|uniref:hypothetical protein n=1 Tax=Streptomyces sp. NBC_01358 TaxID=2903837 RepID=UPI002E358FDA|nr:hypothetical protein [Streptomyces sp. NBC_01358]
MVDQVPAIRLGVLTDEAQAFALVGGAEDTERFTFGGATVVIGPVGTVIVTDAGDRGPDRSGVWNSEEVRLFGPAPAPVTERLTGRTWKWGADDEVLPVHLMIRIEDGLLYLGVSRTVSAATAKRPGCTDYELTRCVVRLEVPLSRFLLDRVRPPLPAVNLPGLEWLRHVNGDRAVALEQFVTGWYPTTDTADTPSTGLPLAPIPDGLRQLYRLAVRRPAALGVQNRIHPESALLTDDRGEMLVFGVENQGGFVWSLLWTLGSGETDPTVWFCDDSKRPIAEQEPLSGFLLQFSLFEAAMGADYLALPRSLELTAHQVDQLTNRLEPVPLRPFWPWGPTRFYVAPGLIMHVCEAGDNKFEAWAGATHRSALALLADATVEWSRFDG